MLPFLLGLLKGIMIISDPFPRLGALADLGQASHPDLPNYQEDGIVLKQGYIELVEEGDPLAGNNNEHVDKIKLYS